MWRNPFLWAALAGLVLIPLMRPLLRFEPPPPPVLGELPGYRLTDQEGNPFGSTELEDRVYVLNLFFTRCPSICPLLTASMSSLDRRYRDAAIDGVQLVSVTVDPEHDDPARLAQYGHEHGIDPGRWKLLTGDGEAIRELVVGGLKLGLGEPTPLAGADRSDGGAGALIDIAHSGRLMLVDRRGRVRGYYDADELGIDELFHRSRHVLKERS